MPYMDPITGFEPGPTTKYLLLFVKKEEKEIGQTKLPGLFQDKRFDIMISFFIIALVLECIGLWFIIDEIGLGFWRGLMSIAFLVLLDLLFAFLYHLKTKTICLCENWNSVSNNDIVIKRNKDKIFWAKFWSYFAAMAIWGLAALKTVSFLALQSLGGGGIDTKTLFILVTYVIVALIHVHFTGYALFGLAARFRWRRDEWRYVHGDQRQKQEYTAQTRWKDVVTCEPIPEKTVGKHIVERVLSVDLMSRDAQGKGRVVLGLSTEHALEEKIRAEKKKYMQERGVTEKDLPQYQAEINEELHREINEMLKVDIDPSNNGILHPKLTDILEMGLTYSPNEVRKLSDDQIRELTRGQTLYRLISEGLLLDDDLAKFAFATADFKARNEIALHGLHLQLQMI